MTKTYTPIIIEGKIYVVVDAPKKPIETIYTSAFSYDAGIKTYNRILSTCTKYETLEQDAPYWEERIGQRVEEGEITIITRGKCSKEPCSCQYDAECPNYSVDHHYAIPPSQKDPLVNMLVTASVGTQSQHDTIQTHMDEYFKRWPSYKDRLTELEWYHLFLDFSDKLAIPPQQKQGDEWDEVMKDIVDYEQGKMMICDLLEGFKSNYNIKRKK